jgi:hypothetical protein
VREICTLGSMWRGLETELWDGLRHRHTAKAVGNSYSPSPKATAPVPDPTVRPAIKPPMPRFPDQTQRLESSPTYLLSMFIR